MPGVEDRCHNLGHSGYFTKEFVQQFWVPFVKDGTISHSKFEEEMPEAPWWISVMGIRLLLPWLLWLLLALVGGLALFFWPVPSSKSKTSTVSVYIQRLELGEADKYWRSGQFSLNLADSKKTIDQLASMAQWIAETVTNQCGESEDFPDAQIDFSPGVFSTNVAIIKSTSSGKGILGTRIMRTQVIQSHRQTNVVLRPKREINYSKEDDSFDVFFWQTKNGQRVAVNRLEDAMANFNTQSESIILQVSKPGFQSSLVMFSPTKALKQAIKLERRNPLRIILFDQNAGLTITKDLELLLGNYGINVIGSSALTKLQAEITNSYTVKTSSDVNSIQDELRRSEADCIVTLVLTGQG